MLGSFSPRLGFAALAVGTVVVSACHPSPPPPPPRPNVADVLGTDKAPLVVDWPVSHRGNLATAMTDGVAVVRVEPKGITLLRDCRLAGSYGFVGFSKKEQLIRLSDATDVSLSLPLRGVGIAADLGADLGASMSLDVALVTVGRQRTPRTSAMRAALKGPECNLATHFVRGFDVGAFVLTTSEKTRVHTVASLFGAKAKYERKGAKDLHETDGEIDACKQADPDAKTPPKGCNAALRLDLKPIDENETVDASTCTSGLVRAEGKCQATAKVAKKVAYECDPTNEAECREQCDAGDGASCGRLANLLRRSTTKAPDFKAIHAVAERGCSAGSERACVVLGEIFQYGNGVAVDAKRAGELYEKACTSGDAGGCFHEGTLYDRRPGLALDHAKAGELYDRACRGGEQDGCNNLGALALARDGAKPEPEKARAIYEDACKNGSATACGNLADLLAGGVGGPKDSTRAGELWAQACTSSGAHCVRLGDALSGMGPLPKDPVRSLDAYQKGIKLLSTHCNLGIADRCDDLGWLFHDGRAVPRDDEQAFTYVKKGCELGSPGACNHVGLFLERGWGVPQNAAEAKKKYSEACDAGNLHACVSRALNETEGAARTALFERACKGGIAVGCYHHGRAQRLHLSDTEARTLVMQACGEGHAPACSYLGRWDVRERSRDANSNLEKGCLQGDAAGCATLAERLASSGKEPERAEAFAKRACDGGVANGCETLAILATAGHTRQVSASEGNGLLQKACDGRDLSSCAKLGSRVLASEPGRAAGLFERACDTKGYSPEKLDEALASHAKNRTTAATAEPAGIRHQQIGLRSGLGGLGAAGGGTGSGSSAGGGRVLVDAFTPKRLLEAREHDLEDAGALPDERHLGCAALGEMHETGNGFAKNVENAQRFYGVACTYDDGRGCAKLASLESKQPKKVKLRIASLYDRACQFEDAAACIESARLASAERKYSLATDFYERACQFDKARCPATEKAIAAFGDYVSKEPAEKAVLATLSKEEKAILKSLEAPPKDVLKQADVPSPDLSKFALIDGNVLIEAPTMSVPIANASRTLANLRSRMRACYTRALQANPTVRGKIVVLAKVAESGEVTSADVASDTTGTPSFSSCVASQLRRVEFSAGTSPSTLSVPFVFHPGTP